MCRFVAYIGKKPILLHDLCIEPINALIVQSYNGKMGTKRIHADGCGLGWYKNEKTLVPHMYKSILPAWKDMQFYNVASQITATCFVGHIRAASVGNISWDNTHPFNCETFLFAHNGTINDFSCIEQGIREELSEMYCLHGQTDSEYFFALLMYYIRKETKPTVIGSMINAYNKAIQTLYRIKQSMNSMSYFKLNIVLTNGKDLIATRFISDRNHEPSSLFYTRTSQLQKVSRDVEDADGLIIASEPLTENIQDWYEVPTNHMLIVEGTDQFKMVEIPFLSFSLLFLFFFKIFEIR